jgi:hypothetical protein
MKILLDESVPQKLRLIIEGGHTVVTAWYQGWSGLKNGALLIAAEQAGFDFVHHGRSGIELPAKSNRAKDGLGCAEK